MSLYDDLGVDPSATKEEIQKAYRKLARKKHPDSGGSKEEFAIINLAHETLVDEKKRSKYDETGKTGSSNELADLIGQLVHECFNESSRNPIKTMRSKIDKLRSGIQQERSKANSDIRKIEKHIEKLLKSNEKIKNRGGVEFIIARLRERLAVARSFIISADDREELLTSAMAFIDQIEYPEEGVRPYEFGAYAFMTST